MIDRLTVTDSGAAALLGHRRVRHILLALIDQERSQRQLSDLLDLPLNLLHHHLGRLTDARLIEVVRSEPRRGRAVRYFRAVARSFFVPAELAAPVPSRPLLDELRHALEKSRAGTYDGVLYTWNQGPRMNVVRNAEPARPAAELWHRMRLDDKDAQALIEEMKQLFARFEARNSASGDLFVMLGAVAPG